MLRGIFLLLAALGAAGGAVAAVDVAGIVTILEGEALITRAATRLRAVEGVRLQVGDIVETGDGTFTQIELVDQTVLQMGPKGRIMVGGAVRLKAERTLYALSGWFKLSNARKEGNVRAFEFRSPLIEIGLLPGVVVMQLKTNEATLFAERGDLKLVERPGGPAVGVRQGQTYRRTFGARGTLGGTAPATFREREVQPRAAPDFVYADVEPWLKAETPFRRQFIERWRSKARDSAFRTALIGNLSSHPEWDPVLFPEKYLPKPTPGASAPVAGTVGTASAIR
jgi:hypothetical protein